MVGAFPGGHSALMLVADRLRHVSATARGTHKYMNMRLPEEMDRNATAMAAIIMILNCRNDQNEQVFATTPSSSDSNADISAKQGANQVRPLAVTWP